MNTPDPKLSERLRADALFIESATTISGTRTLGRNMRESADALDSLQAQLAEAQKQLAAKDADLAAAKPK